MSLIGSIMFRSLRIMLGDLDPSVQRYPDATLSDGVKTTVLLGRINSIGPIYTLTPDESGITPNIGDPNTFALLIYHTAKLFVDPEHDRFAFRTRGFSESFGSRNRFLSTLEIEIHKLENGEMFSGWQNYFSWLSGMAGLPLAEVLTDMHVNAPLWNTTLTREGLRTIPDQTPHST
jgi:hypothetical protein